MATAQFVTCITIMRLIATHMCTLFAITAHMIGTLGSIAHTRIMYMLTGFSFQRQDT